MTCVIFLEDFMKKIDNDIKYSFKKILNHSYTVEDLKQFKYNEYIIEYNKNETIINVKEPVDYVYFLLDGQASIWGEIEWANNIIAYIYPNELLGLLEILNEIDTYTAFVLAETKCRVFRIPRDTFIDMLQTDCDLCYKTLKLLGRMTSKNMEDANIKKLFSHYDIIGYYLFLQSKHKLPYTCYYTRSQLSEILNINLRTLYRNISLLEEDGLLNIKKGKIIVDKENFTKLENRYENIII